MILLDVNVLIYAFRRDSVRHRDYNHWLEKVLENNESFGISNLVLSAMIQIVTHSRIYVHPTPLQEAVSFTKLLQEQPHCVLIEPSARHWDIFVELCKKANAKGNLITDAYFAALALESGSEWVTTDRDYARFPGLKWRHPLEN